MLDVLIFHLAGKDEVRVQSIYILESEVEEEEGEEKRGEASGHCTYQF